MAKIRRQLKVNERDDQLPRTRWKLFGRLIKDDFYLLIDLSLVETLFSIPLIATLIVEYVYLTSVEVKFGNVFPIIFYMGLISVVGFGIKYVGRNAAFSVMKKRVHNEGSFISVAVMSSIRTSGIKSLFNGLIAGLFAFIAASGSVYLLFVSDTFLKWAGIGALIVLFVIAFGTAEYFSVSENFYELGFFAQFKNSVIFSVSTFPLTLVHFIAFFGLRFALALFSPWLAIAALAVFSLGGNGLTVAAATLVGHKVFDVHINREYYPEYVDKGLLKKNEVE